MARLIIASEIGAHLGRDGLVAAEREVVSRLASIGICGEDRAYRPHLTDRKSVV